MICFLEVEIPRKLYCNQENLWFIKKKKIDKKVLTINTIHIILMRQSGAGGQKAEEDSKKC